MAGSATRFSLVRALSVFCCHIKFQYDFQGLKGGYKPKPRNLPSDEEIIEAWQKIQVGKLKPTGESYGWAFGMLATYGLRSHELLAIDYKKSLKPPYYEIYLDEELTDGLKTGSRTVYPFHAEWVHKFDLINVKNRAIINLKVGVVRERVSQRFKLRDIGFVPYDLRHRYAIRGHELGVPIGQMAKWMGYSVQMHTEKYQRWMQDSTHKKVYEQVLERINKPQEIAKEMPSYEDTLRKNAELEEKVRWLTAQLAELKK